MESDWTETTLGSLGRIVTGKTPPKKIEDAFGSEFPFVTPRDFNGRRNIISTERNLSQTGVESVIKSLVPENSIAVSCIGSDMGKTAIIKQNSVTNQQINTIIVSDKFHYKYVYYDLSVRKEEIRNAAGGSAQPILNKTHFSELRIKLPPLPEQKRIAHILGSLDDKIELNRKMNATLEAMAQALFKSWFVDFDPVIDNALRAGNPIPAPLQQRAETRRKALEENKDTPFPHSHLFPATFTESEDLGWIPEGWETSTLGNFLEIKRGGSPRPIKDYIQPTGLPWVKIADATASPSRFLFTTKECIKPEGLKKTVLLKKGALILSNSATPGLPIFLELDACIHDGWLHFPKKEYFGDQYLYQLFLVIRKELVNKGNGSVFTNLKTDILRAQDIVVPPSAILEIFEQWARPNFDKIKSVNIENQTLAKLRDSLLPKLISGELRLPASEQLTEEALV